MRRKSDPPRDTSPIIPCRVSDPTLFASLSSLPVNQPIVTMRAFFRERPWIWVCVAFLVLFGAWTALFTIALNNQPEKIPLPEHSVSHE